MNLNFKPDFCKIIQKCDSLHLKGLEMLYLLDLNSHVFPPFYVTVAVSGFDSNPTFKAHINNTLQQKMKKRIDFATNYVLHSV